MVYHFPILSAWMSFEFADIGIDEITVHANNNIFAS